MNNEIKEIVIYLVIGFLVGVYRRIKWDKRPLIEWIGIILVWPFYLVGSFLESFLKWLAEVEI